jgi:hypothetical protein
MIKTTVRISLLVAAFQCFCFAQLYKGPASGISEPGIITNTNSVLVLQKPGTPKLNIYNKLKGEDIPGPEFSTIPRAPIGSNIFRDPSVARLKKSAAENGIIEFASFNGIEDAVSPNSTVSIPPDPYIAAGPEHLIQVVNTRFRITDKNGNQIKSIWASNWYAGLGIENVSPFDCKVIYDHHSRRWIMVWLHVDFTSSEAYILISASEDSSAEGNWYSWKMASTVNGITLSGKWADYPGIGFDNKAIYITTNEFSFDGSKPATTKIKIIPKSELYRNTIDPLYFMDIYDIKYPDYVFDAFNIRAARMHTLAEGCFFIAHSRYTSKNSLAVYELIDPLGSPILSGVVMPVTQYDNPTDANQLEGGTPLIDIGNGTAFYNEPFYRDGILHCVHNIGFGASPKYSAIRYLAIDMQILTPLVDIAMGKEEFWYYYPAVAADKNNNAVISFSRSGLAEYPGAYYTVIPSVSGIPLGSFEMKAGQGNYIRTHGGERNRWGDYNGAWVDPSDENNIWLISEFASSAVYQNIGRHWGNWVTGIRLTAFGGEVVPAQTKVLYASSGLLSSGNMFTVNLSDGSGNLLGESKFSLVNSISIDPVSKFIYGLAPLGNGKCNLIRISSADGSGYILHTLNIDSLTSISFNNNGNLFIARESGQIYLFDISSGTESLKTTASISINGMAFEPQTNELFICTPAYFGQPRDRIYRVNIDTGDTLLIGKTNINKPHNDLIFDENGTLYSIVGTNSQVTDLIKIDLNTGVGSIIGSSGHRGLTGLAYLTGLPASIDDESKQIFPGTFTLSQNYPNPFNPATTIEYNLPIDSYVRIKVYNSIGEIVSELVNQFKPAGTHRVQFNTFDIRGGNLSSGVYFYEIKAEGIDGSKFKENRKMVLLR